MATAVTIGTTHGEDRCGARGYAHWPLPETVFGAASPGHLRSHVAPPLQLIEQGDAEQVTWHVELPVQDTLPLFPTVTVHDELSQLMLPLSPVVRVQVLEALQSALHEPRQLPLQVLALRHASDWLAAGPASAAELPPQVHAPPAWHVHAAPWHVHPGPGQAEGGTEPPHEERRERLRANRTSRITARSGVGDGTF